MIRWCRFNEVLHKQPISTEFRDSHAAHGGLPGDSLDRKDEERVEEESVWYKFREPFNGDKFV